MSITKCPGHMRSLKLNFSATVLTLGLKAKSFENLRLLSESFGWNCARATRLTAVWTGAWAGARCGGRGLVAGLRVGLACGVLLLPGFWGQQLQPPGSWAPNLHMRLRLLNLIFS